MLDRIFGTCRGRDTSRSRATTILQKAPATQKQGGHWALSGGPSPKPLSAKAVDYFPRTEDTGTAPTRNRNAELRRGATSCAFSHGSSITVGPAVLAFSLSMVPTHEMGSKKMVLMYTRKGRSQATRLHRGCC